MNDTYTKIVLTVIAICLLWISVNGLAPSARAQGAPDQPMRVVLVDERNVPLATTEGLRVNFGTAPPLRVAVTNAALPVALTAIQRTGAWQPVEVRVLREPPTLAPVP